MIVFFSVFSIAFSIAVYIVFGIIVAKIASNKGYRDVDVIWFIYGFLVFPIALTHVLLIGSRGEEKDWRGKMACELCAEYVWPEAKLCPHCKNPFSPVTISRKHTRKEARWREIEAERTERLKEIEAKKIDKARVKAEKESKERAAQEPNHQKNLAASKAWEEKMRRKKMPNP